ncbi:B12-binding domain-containing radical SAM protein [candidate division WOR-3 bacterium]|nr:B12-binding domain-containing radical SAM protein [candidate division WOR-3 bacterium]
MNVLLVYPEIPDTFWSFKHAVKFIHKKAMMPPLGLLTVAAILPEEWEKKLVDMNIEKLTVKNLEWADMVLISGMSIQKKSAAEVIDQCRIAGKKVVVGGPLFTLERELFDKVDHFVLNEGEITLPEFLDDLKKGSEKKIYETKKHADLDLTPVPLWSLVKMGKYAMMPIQYSRGCPFNCEFCNITSLFGRIPRLKKADKITEELDQLYSRGWRGGVFFVDDNFIGNKKKLKEDLLPSISKWRKGKKGIQLVTEVSINVSDDDELLRMMLEAGFDTLFIGIESPNSASLLECNKVQNLNRNIISNIKKLQKMGFTVQGGFIVGFDSDTAMIFQQIIDFIQKSGITTAMVGLLQAPPGTRLYERMKKANRIKTKFSGDNTDCSTNIVPVMKMKNLREGYERVIRKIYSSKFYYRRINTFLDEYHRPDTGVRFDFKNKIIYVSAFLRSIILLGVFGSEKLYFWKLLLKTFFKDIKNMPIAVTLAIYGRHFRKVTNNHLALDRKA